MIPDTPITIKKRTVIDRPANHRRSTEFPGNRKKTRTGSKRDFTLDNLNIDLDEKELNDLLYYNAN